MAVWHHGMQTCPSSAPTQVLSLRPSPRRKKKQSKAKTETNKKKPRDKAQGLSKRANRRWPGNLATLGVSGRDAPPSPALHPADPPTRWSPERLLWGPGSHDFSRGQPGSEPGSAAVPLATWVSPTPGETRPHGPRHTQPGCGGARSKRGLTATHPGAQPDRRTSSSPTRRGSGSGARHPHRSPLSPGLSRCTHS